MIDPGDILEALVTKLRLIADLVTEVTPDPDDSGLTAAERIYGYHDLYPHQASLPRAIHAMPAGSVMVVWEGTGPGTSDGGMFLWKHQFAAYLRMRPHADTDANPSTYYRLYRFIIDGTPTGSPAPMLYLEVHASCLPMDLPSIARDTDAERLDYFKVTLGFTEK